MDASHRNGQGRRLRRRALAIGAVLVLGSLPLRWWEDQHWSTAHDWIVVTFRGEGCAQMLHILTSMGSGEMISVVLACLLVIVSGRELVWRAAAAALMSGVINSALKFTVGRSRPLADQYDAWPSGHTAAGVAVTVALWLVSRRAGLIALPVVVAIAVTRVLLLRHFPADVMAGIGVGLILGTVAGTVGRVPRALLAVDVRWLLLGAVLILWWMRTEFGENRRQALGTIGGPLLLLASWHALACDDSTEETR